MTAPVVFLIPIASPCTLAIVDFQTRHGIIKRSVESAVLAVYKSNGNGACELYGGLHALSVHATTAKS